MSGEVIQKTTVRKEVKTVLCYGDSNTWGQPPAAGGRYAPEQRWVGVMQERLGEEYLVIPEGLSGRTTVFDDHVEGLEKNGKPYLLPCLGSHKPLDLVIIFLGTNDLKERFAASASDIAAGAGTLVDIVTSSACGPNDQSSQVLLIAPPPIGSHNGFGEMFVGGYEKSLLLGECYRDIAEVRGCEFLDAGSLISSSKKDGIHLDAGEHRKLGTTVAGIVKSILSGD